MCELDQLSENSSFTVNRCNECHKITIRHKHYVLEFTSESFNRFRDFMANLNFQAFSQTYQGEEQMMVRISTTVRLSLTHEELEQLKSALAESSTMMQVYDILRS